MEQEKVKTNAINLKELKNQHEVHKLVAEIAEFRLRQVMADMRYMELITKFNAPENEAVAQKEQVMKEEEQVPDEAPVPHLRKVSQQY